MKLTKLEKELFLNLLEITSRKFSNSGCNDFYIPNSPEAVELLNKIEERQIELGDIETNTYDEAKKNITTLDFIVLEYFVKKIKEET